MDKIYASPDFMWHENDNDDLNEVVSGILNWIENSDVFERDERPGHKAMGHCIGGNVANEAMGVKQQEIFFPVKLKRS